MIARCENCGHVEPANSKVGESQLCPMCDTLVKVVKDTTGEVELRYPHRRILVVEDSRSLRAMLKDVLEEAGFSVALASDGQEALQILHETLPDLVLLDLRLPRKDGFDVLREAKTIPQCADVPFLVMSAVYRTPDDMRRMQDLGARGFIDKDCLFETVLDRVHAQVAAA